MVKVGNPTQRIPLYNNVLFVTLSTGRMRVSICPWHMYAQCQRNEEQSRNCSNPHLSYETSSNVLS